MTAATGDSAPRWPSTEAEARDLAEKAFLGLPAAPTVSEEIAAVTALLMKLSRCADRGSAEQGKAQPECTGSSASWCPVHGDCECPYLNDNPDEGRTLDDPGCPLHGEKSEHAKEPPRLPAGHIYHADPLVERICREWLVEGQTANDLEGVLARTRAACLKFSAGYHAHRKCIEGWTQPIPGQENWNDMRARLVREATEAGGQAAGEATAEGLVFGFDWVARTLASALLETGEMPDVREEALVKQAATAIRGRRSLTSENVARLADVERILASPKGACTVGDLLGHLRWAAEILAASRDVASDSAEKQTPTKVDPTDMRRFYGLVTACHAGRDGECNWRECPQTRDGEPKKSGRHCPLDKESDE